MDGPRFHDCVRKGTPQQLATSKFVIVKYRQMSPTNRRAVPLHEGQLFNPGDLVYIQAGNCETPVVPRVREVLDVSRRLRDP